MDAVIRYLQTSNNPLIHVTWGPHPEGVQSISMEVSPSFTWASDGKEKTWLLLLPAQPSNQTWRKELRNRNLPGHETSLRKQSRLTCPISSPLLSPQPVPVFTHCKWLAIALIVSSVTETPSLGSSFQDLSVSLPPPDVSVPRPALLSSLVLQKGLNHLTSSHSFILHPKAST